MEGKGIKFASVILAKDLKIGADIATIVLAILGVISLIYVIKQVSAIREEGRVTRTFDYIKKFHEP